MVEGVGVLRAVVSAVAALELHAVEDAGAIFTWSLPDTGGSAADADNLLWLIGGVRHSVTPLLC